MTTGKPSSLQVLRSGALLTRVGLALFVVALGIFGFRAYGAAGLALVAGGVLMWALLQWTRTMHTLKATARNPVGSVASAVMLNARLQQGMPLLQVLALTKALGRRVLPDGDDPETYEWTDAGQVSVRAQFRRGQLARWELLRP